MVSIGARASKGVGEVASEREDSGDQVNKRIRKCGKGSGEKKGGPDVTGGDELFRRPGRDSPD